MPLPPYPPDFNVRRAKYTLPSTSPAPVVGTTPDDQVLVIDSVKAVRVGVQAPDGQTLTGEGFLRCHYLDSASGAACWGPTPELDISLSGAAGRPVYWVADVQVWVPAGRMHLQPEGVTCSGGGPVTIHVVGAQ